MAHAHKGKKFIYLDLGYWHRRPAGKRWTGYHKFAINGFHPDEYFQQNNPDDRWRASGFKMRKWHKDGKKVVVIGTSEKAAKVQGLEFQQWERETIARLREITDRKIIYRAKPNSREAKPIAGTQFSQTEPLDALFRNAHIVVMHHSNVAVDAMIWGVPIYCEEGVGRTMSLARLEDLDTPYYPEDRYQFLSDVAYCQWNCDEIAKGKPWRYYKDKGLLP